MTRSLEPDTPTTSLVIHGEATPRRRGVASIRKREDAQKAGGFPQCAAAEPWRETRLRALWNRELLREG
jgi:hypothetical protein